MERRANSLFSLVKDLESFPRGLKQNGKAKPPARPRRTGSCRRGCWMRGGRPPARTGPGGAVLPGLAVARNQLRDRRFFSRYLMSLTWAGSNPRAVPTSLLDRPAISISRAASVLVFV